MYILSCLCIYVSVDVCVCARVRIHGQPGYVCVIICNMRLLAEVSISLGRFAGQPRYFVTDSLRDSSKRVRRSEREFCGDHAHLHQHQHWYKDYGILSGGGFLRGKGAGDP